MRTIDPARARPARAIAIAIILLSFDLLLISGDLMRRAGVLQDARFAVTTERGYGEWFQYIKAAAVALMLLRSRRRSPAALAWAGLFIYLLLDDAFALHEAFGLFAASKFAWPAIGPARPEQIAELLIHAGVGLAFIGSLAAILRRGDVASRSLSVALSAPFALLVFFGAAVDILHSYARDTPYRYAAGVIEDGGEMVAMSLLVAVTYWATRPEQDPTLPSRRLPARGSRRLRSWC